VSTRRLEAVDELDRARLGGGEARPAQMGADLAGSAGENWKLGCTGEGRDRRSRVRWACGLRRGSRGGAPSEKKRQHSRDREDWGDQLCASKHFANSEGSPCIAQ